MKISSKFKIQSSKLLKYLRKKNGNWKMEIGNSGSGQLGYSIIELLVVVSIFSVIILISTQAIVLTLRSSRKGESLITVRENVDYAFSVMERHLRSAEDITCTSQKTLTYTDQWGVSGRTFSCIGGDDGYIASSSSALTSDEVAINCDEVPIFTCNIPGGGFPSSVEIDVVGSKTGESAIEGAELTSSTRILLRTY